jgi:hypothetical protein
LKVLAAATALNGNFSFKVTTTVTALKKSSREGLKSLFCDRDRKILYKYHGILKEPTTYGYGTILF